MRARRVKGARTPGMWLVTAMVLAVLALTGGCRTREPAPAPAPPGSAQSPPGDPASGRASMAAPSPDSWICANGEPDPSPAVVVFETGREVRRVCAADARREGLTIVDLSDDWVPRALREPEGNAQPQPYRATYVALANEEFPPGTEGDRPRRDAFLEVYGISPSLRVAAGRLLDEDRHRCAATIDVAAVLALATSPRPSEVRLTPGLEAAFDALDQRLVCERLLPATTRRRPRWRLGEALEAFQRKNTIVSRGLLDGETRRALAEHSRELDFRTLLRVLRARVIDATGLIEDGTAAAARGEILARRIDGEAFLRVDDSDVVEGGAPDLISPATEAAAIALGWTDPGAAAEFFRRRGPDGTRRLVVGLRLPPVPAYHSEHMQLAVEIDRGDVWYELPTRRGPIARRPKLTLYATTPEGE